MNNLELIRYIENLRKDVSNIVKPELPNLIVYPFLDLPAKVGLWYMGDVQRSTGNVYDRSVQGRTLTYNGNPVFNIYNNYAAYLTFDGTGDYLSRADETDMDILGTETIYAAAVKGITMGCWAYFANASGSNEHLMAKGAASPNRAYWLVRDAAGPMSFRVSGDGTAITQVDSTVNPVSGKWYFVVGRYDPSTELAIFVNGVKTANTALIPANLINTTANFNIGAYSTADRLTGRVSIAFLLANIISDSEIDKLYQLTKFAYQ